MERVSTSSRDSLESPKWFEKIQYVFGIDYTQTYEQKKKEVIEYLFGNKAALILMILAILTTLQNQIGAARLAFSVHRSVGLASAAFFLPFFYYPYYAFYDFPSYKVAHKCK